MDYETCELREMIALSPDDGFVLVPVEKLLEVIELRELGGDIIKELTKSNPSDVSRAFLSHASGGVERKNKLVSDRKSTLITELVGALENAQQFIENGIEFGYIHMPDDDVNDRAKKTPGIIQAALTKAKDQTNDR